MPETTKKEHYVPRVYLRHFCAIDDKLNVYDKISNQIRYNQPIMSIASENYFYDIDFKAMAEKINSDDEILQQAKGLDPQYIEHMFSSGMEAAYETIIGEIIKRLEKRTKWELTECFAISENEKIFMALWIAHQVTRTKSFREYLSKFHQATAKVLTDMVNKRSDSDYEIEVTANTDKENMKVLHANFIIDPDKTVEFAKVFLSHTWIFMVNKSSTSFATSDNPVVTIPHKYSSNNICATGYASPNVEVFYPLSSHVGLMMFEKGLKYEELERRSIICNKAATIKEYNLRLLSNASRIVATSDENLDVFQKFAQDHPEIKESKLSLISGGKIYYF